MRVVYSPEQSAVTKPGEIGLSDGKLSPSVNKPQLVVDAWKNAGIPMEIIPSEPVPSDLISLVHDPKYVQGVLTGTIKNGHGNYHLGVRNSLPWVVGSFVKAAKLAYEERRPYVSPTSGFHHACYGWGEGFCTFNGLMVAAMNFRKLYPDRLSDVEIGIVDLDDHYGNGTDDIIKKLNVSHVQHFTYGRSNRSLRYTNFFFDELASTLNHFQKSDLIFYQAGADSHVDDPMGSQSMTTEHMRIRDEMVFSFCKENDIPVVWNLAGGYQTPIEKVLALHVQTAQVFTEVFGNS